MKIAILILAAGTASRMGEIKQLLPYKETFMVDHVIKNAQEVVEDVYVVLGANAEIIEQKLQNNNVKKITNQHYKKGLSSSIICGVKTLLDYDAILICLADQPKIDVAYYKELIAVFKESSDVIVASRYEGFNGVPAIFPKSYYSKLLELNGDKGAKHLLNSKLNFIKTIASSEKLLDIDTPEDYKKLTNL